ncbi:unnamed protein product [Ilex paraguariensis]|uniref:DNA/RNA-binding protein Alba-like domain-containing protein n=1 Tax=Ilex paraguariensis TaxID=185542 RepID=A0ABC8UA45_9AQUA
MASSKYTSLIALSALFCFFFFFDRIVHAQMSIPAKYDGFIYKNRSATTDSIMIEAFFDPVCPDSRDSWPPLKQALDHYGPLVSLIVHPFPLPYHDNAFTTSRALHIVNKLDTSATYDLLELFFKKQEELYNKQTFNMSRESIVKQVTKLAARAVGNSYYSAIEAAFNDRETDLLTRVSFKYGCTRGVYGTPFFFVNGFSLPDADPARDYDGWRSVIDPLIGKKGMETGDPKMDRYQRVEKPKAETPIEANEIRITSQGRMRSYITYAMSLLQVDTINFGQLCDHDLESLSKKGVNVKTKPKKRALSSWSLLSYPYSKKKMDRYQRVEKPKAETPIEANEIRITSQGRMRSYITYAMSLLQEKGSTEIVFKAMGRAINKTVTIVELIKRRIIGLHQITSIQSTDITDMWEPLEEGLLPLETTRHVSMITITLSKKELDTSSVGYQPPLPADMVKVSTEFDYEGERSPTGQRGRGGRGRGRPRTFSGNGFASSEYEDGGYNRGYARGRGRGRGRNFHGRGRGWYNGPPMDTRQDAGDYNQEAPYRGRGRGRGRGNRGRGRGFRSNGPIHAAAVGA